MNNSIYPYAMHFTKMDTLKEYASTDKFYDTRGNISDATKAHYDTPKIINLVVSFRWDHSKEYGRRLMCRINCPINPIPVKGEFQAPSLKALRKFLEKEHWNFHGYVETRTFIR